MQAFADALCERLHLVKFDEHPALKNERGIRPSYIILGLLTFGALFVISEYSVYWTSVLCGLLFPAFLTYKSLESDDSEEDTEDERKFWLTYWIIIGLIHTVEFLFKTALHKIPLFNVLKLGFLIWLQHPSTRGAIVIYENALRNLLKEHEKDIDDHLQSLRRFSKHKKVFDDVIKSAKKKAVERIVS